MTQPREGHNMIECPTCGGFGPWRPEGHAEWCADVRTELARLARADRMVPPECGTDGGYQRHLRQGEPTCQPCRNAEAKRMRDVRARRAERAARRFGTPSTGA